MSDKKKNYEVGYKKPPKKGQFKKGESGNPTGRKKGSSNFFTLAEAELDELITISSTGEQITKREAIVKKWIADAAMGKPKAREQIFEMYAHEFEEEKLKAEARKKTKLIQIEKTFDDFTDEQLDEIIAFLQVVPVGNKAGEPSEE